MRVDPQFLGVPYLNFVFNYSIFLLPLEQHAISICQQPVYNLRLQGHLLVFISASSKPKAL
jgi:hypothetical protein